MKVCQNCKKNAVYAKNRCQTCYNYFWRNGYDRLEWLYLRRQYCINCAATPIHAKQRCHTCYVYFISHGKDRSTRLYEKKKICRNSNCKKPLSGKRNRNGGFCDACHKYRRRHRGRNRPKELCFSPGIIGWCDCGQPAKYEKQIIVGKRTKETLILCEECYGYEQEIKRGPA